MNIYEEIAASWVAFDVVLVAIWHFAHVALRAPRSRPRPAAPVTVSTHTGSPKAQLALVHAA